MRNRPILAALVVGGLLLCCGAAFIGRSGGRVAARATPSPAPSATPAPPTATLSPEEALRAALRDASPPVYRDGAPVEVRRSGERIEITMPILADGTNEQIVRLGRLRMMNAVLAAFDSDPAVVEVNVVGTTPLSGSEAPAISVVVQRGELARWDGTTENAPGAWQVGGRLR